MTERDYHTSTWEYIHIASDYLIPFFFESAQTAYPSIWRQSPGGSFVNIIGRFTGTDLVTSLTKNGSGTWNIIGGDVISTGTVAAAGYMESNTMTLTAGVNYMVLTEPDSYTDRATFQLQLYKGGVTEVWAEAFDSYDGLKVFSVDTTGADYTLRIVNASGGTEDCIDTNTIECFTSTIYQAGDYWYYNGGQLSGTALSGINRFKVVWGSDVFYTDWCDVSGFDDLTKYKISADVDYGGVPYSSDYAQWIYKDADVRRSPRAEVEILSESRNGVRIDEKIVTAVRYVLNIKVTESEFETFVHSVGGTIEITGKDGRVYNATDLEITDPVWYNTNGTMEISFLDTNNINTWTQNQ
jgi:hypothetical protein